MMDALLRKHRWRYSLLIVLTIVGLEIDVLSNPFTWDFVLCRLFSVLDESSTGPVCPRDVAEPAGAASAAMTCESESEFTTDETVAILPQKPAKYLADASCFTHAYVRVNASLPSLAIARGDSPAHFFPTSGLLRLQLCRFLC
ncbi:MAG: hypothetical protein ACLP7Q_04955 [Isosphaeraceae bacterium]